MEDKTKTAVVIIIVLVVIVIFVVAFYELVYLPIHNTEQQIGNLFSWIP